jgi:hypothetical protein
MEIPQNVKPASIGLLISAYYSPDGYVAKTFMVVLRALKGDT